MLSRSKFDRDERREAILDVAEHVFLTEGLGAASMSAIAARLGGSKGTLYNYFKGKAELFKAYVLERGILDLEDIYGREYKGATVPETLTKLGRAYLGRGLSDRHLRHLRLIVSEAERSPEIGRIFYDNGPRYGAERLTERIAAWSAKGLLAAPSPELAAHQFIGLVQNRYFKARLYNERPELTGAEIETEVGAAVDTFMRAFRPC
jgi:AcrR family transcriptional regulator